MMILVTGGTGYIGSHTVVELMVAGREVFLIDNLSNSKASVLERIERIAGRRPGKIARCRAGELPSLASIYPN